MTRCLILSCSKAKNEDSRPLPAVLRYDGPAYKVFRLFQKKGEQRLINVDLYILSAEYGLISGNDVIENYDQKMNACRAAEINAKVLKQFSRFLVKGYDELFISMSKEYLKALEGYQTNIPKSTTVTVSSVSEGLRLRQLKSWLYQQEYEQQHEPRKIRVSGKAILKGKVVEMSPEKILQLAKTSLKASNGAPYSYREWYVDVGKEKVSPKWLVSLLTGLEVSEFQASDARRVLAQLGVLTKHV